MKRHLSNIAAVVTLSLSSCAPDAGMLTRNVQDHCAWPSTVAALVAGLNNTAGMKGATLRDVTTVQVDRADIDFFIGTEPISGPQFVCHATIVEAGGAPQTGRILVGTLGTDFTKVAWLSDADHQRFLVTRAVARARDEQVQREQWKLEAERLRREREERQWPRG
jgi:hypothetical protein